MLLDNQDKGFWKQLDENLIYYQNGNYLRIKNTQSNETRLYFKIRPKNLRPLNKYNSYINIFIETSQQTLIGKLDKSQLNLKIKYSIFQENLFYQEPIYDFKNKIFFILQDRKFIQMTRNKLIRKYKGKLDQIAGNNLMTRMGFSSDHKLSYNDYLFDFFETIFEDSLNISILEIEMNYGTQFLKTEGDFLILRNYNKENLNIEQLQVYYLSMDAILQGEGIKGKICLGNNETLKLIKCINNLLYVVIQKEIYIRIYIIKNGDERELIFQCFFSSDILKPILQKQCLIFTNQMNRYIPEIRLIDLK